MGVKDAIALMLIPAFITNLWQAVVGGAFVVIVRRQWTLLATAWYRVLRLCRRRPGEGYTATVSGVRLSHERYNVAEAEAVDTADGRAGDRRSVKPHGVALPWNQRQLTARILADVVRHPSPVVPGREMKGVL